MNYSYSRLSMFDRCPKKFHYKYIELYSITDDSAVFEKGRYLHSLLEHYPNIPEFKFEFLDVEDKKDLFIEQIHSLCKYEPKVKFLLKNCIAREQQFYLERDINLSLVNCEKDDQLINGVIDYVGKVTDSVILCDWKSGQTQKYASFEQLKLYSIWAFNEFPEINNIILFLYFIEQNLYLRLDLNRDKDFEVIKQNVLNKINTIETTKEYNKIKKEDCQYCPYFQECNPYKVKI